jgi:hypothetical protein
MIEQAVTNCTHDPTHRMCSECASDTVAFKAKQVADLSEQLFHLASVNADAEYQVKRLANQNAALLEALEACRKLIQDGGPQALWERVDEQGRRAIEQVRGEPPGTVERAMSHTKGTFRQSADGYSILTNLGKWQTTVAEVDDSQIDPDETVANCRRFVAAWNACREISTENLEAIAAKGLTMEFTLSASLALRAVELRERSKLADLSSFDGVKRFMQEQK